MTHVEYARAFPAVDVGAAYAAVMPVPLEQLLGRRYLAIPGITRVDQERPWGRELGQRRVLHFSDGGRTTEVLTVLDAPSAFGYELTDIRGATKLLIAEVDGVWAFTPDAGGTRITWSWEIVPTTLGRVAMPVFTRMWRGMAARAFDEIEALLAPR